MRKLIAASIVSSLVLVASLVHAGEFGDLKKKIGEARDAYVTMLKNADKRGADQQKLVKDTADNVSKTLAGMKAPAGKEPQFKQLVGVWDAFKKTREEELVPLTVAGKQQEAEKLAGGIQKERFMKINELCDSLGN